MYYRRNMLHTVDTSNPDTYMTNPYPKGFAKSTIPEGTSGNWKIDKFSIDPDRVGLMNLRALRDGHPQRVIPLGDYTRLLYRPLMGGCNVVMSDTPAEAHEHNHAYHLAQGQVLINGLGLGFFLEAILKKSEVLHVTVIELSSDVIKLVGPTFAKERVAIVQADALEWRPVKAKRFDFVWHDIWRDICGDNKPEMTKLRRAYGRRTEHQACWSEEYM